MLLLQVAKLVRTIIPADRLPDFNYHLFASSTKRLEMQSKKAARVKVGRIIDHALDCHGGYNVSVRHMDSFGSQNTGNYDRLATLNVHGRISKALSSYQAQIGKTETIGGIWWTIRHFWLGNQLLREEGVLVFPRLLWSNLGQVLVVLILIYVWIYLGKLVRGLNDPVFEGLSRRG